MDKKKKKKREEGLLMRRILVIFGGCSTEYEVSLQSAAAVAEAIDVRRYEVLYLE